MLRQSGHRCNQVVQRLEKVLQCKLSNTRSTGSKALRRGQLAECTIANGIIGVKEVRMVEQIKELTAELELAVIADRELLK